MWYPYRFFGGKLPDRVYNGRLWDLIQQVKEGHFTPKKAWIFVADIAWFHLQVWFNPRYSFRATGFKWRYFASLLEALIWGYGERPARVLGTSAFVIAAFSAVYYFLQIKKIFLESLYYSVFTFTTLGYGDVTQLSNGMKVATSAEVVAGIVLLGLYVGTLANRARY